LGDQEAESLLVLDNLHRKDLSGVETLESVLSLKSQGLSNQQIGEMFGRNKKYVANIYTLRDLPPGKMDLAREKRLTLGAMFRLQEQQEPRHERVAPPDDQLQVIRSWKISPKGRNKLLSVVLRSDGEITVADALAFFGLK
jgi:hypothetical protein